MNGNTNTTPPSSSNSARVNPDDTYLGTPDAKDVSFVTGGNELLRLKQFSYGSRIGFSNHDPEYSLDMRTTENSNITAIQGLRIISKMFSILPVTTLIRAWLSGTIRPQLQNR